MMPVSTVFALPSDGKGFISQVKFGCYSVGFTGVEQDDGHGNGTGRDGKGGVVGFERISDGEEDVVSEIETGVGLVEPTEHVPVSLVALNERLAIGDVSLDVIIEFGDGGVGTRNREFASSPIRGSTSQVHDICVPNLYRSFTLVLAPSLASTLPLFL